MQSNRYLHSIGSYPCSIGSYLSSIRSYFHSIGSYLSSIRSYFNYFVASYMTLVYSSVVFHIYPYLRGNSIPSDRNYRSTVVTIWSTVKRGRLNLDLVLVWRHTTYDYMTYNWKSSRTWSHADGVDSVYISRHMLSWIKEIRIQETFKETFSKEKTCKRWQAAHLHRRETFETFYILLHWGDFFQGSYSLKFERWYRFYIADQDTARYSLCSARENCVSGAEPLKCSTDNLFSSRVLLLTL